MTDAPVHPTWLANWRDNQHIRPQDRRGQHERGGPTPGLLLKRYLCENATGEDGNPEEKRAILQAAINATVNEEVRALYRIAFDRWSASLPSVRARRSRHHGPINRRSRVGERVGNRHPTAPYLRHADHSRLGSEGAGRPLLRPALG